MKAISLFCGAGGMDVGFESAGINVLWANEYSIDAVNTYKANHPHTYIEHADIRGVKTQLKKYAGGKIDVIFGGPPCQGFSVAGKMDPNDKRSALIWEFLDVVEIVLPKMFVIENVKALGELSRWKPVREKIIKKSNHLGYHCFFRILNAADYGVPQKRERVFFIGIKQVSSEVERIFDSLIIHKRQPRQTLRECLLKVGKAGTPENPLSCTAKISLASNPVLRKSPYAGMLFNGMGRPLNFEGQANTLPASMGGNKTPIVDDLLLHNPLAENWIVSYHKKLISGDITGTHPEIPSYLRRMTIKEAAAIQTFPPEYIFHGEKSSIYRQIGNAVPCNLAQAIAETIIETAQNAKNLRTAVS